MTPASYCIAPTALATATALILSLPTLGDPRNLGPQQIGSDAFEPLDRTLSALVANAVQQGSYVIGDSMTIFSLMTELATRLVRNSQSLDADFANTVDKEFWNLLR
jgi:hypothetical protein